MKKKIILGLGALVIAVGGVAAMSAYEAHVINVTAHIENALSVSPKEIVFGTVFPQEYLERAFTINLSDSFKTADRVDDVEYVIKQKIKCKLDPVYQGETLPMYAPVNYWDHQCPTNYLPMLSLCDYLSKLPQDGEITDVGEPSYYDKDSDSCPPVSVPMIAHGKLAKSEQDTIDNWMVDLKVPPVKGYVGQDWPAGCPTVDEDSQDYGCDLWIEVVGISLPGGDIGCVDKADVMLTLDKSGSINTSELAFLKTAANAFVTAMAPTTDGVHMGEVSFETVATLDVHLTDNATTLIAAINGLVTGNLTNLQQAIDLSAGELANPGDGHDRTDADSPDYMVIITDGVPTAGGDAAAAAAAAKAAGITIYVVGIGDGVNVDFLMNQIASSPSHYYGIANWEALEILLQGIGSCP